NAGYSAGPCAGRDLAEEAIFLARLLDQLRAGEAESEGCLALLLITHARRAARTDGQGVTVPLDEQDRSLWKRDEIKEGVAVLDQALARRAPGPYQIKAAIAACHCAGAQSDWRQICALYDSLLRFEPTPVVRLNRAVAFAEAGALDVASRLLEELEGELRAYQPYHAASAALLARRGKFAEARVAYDRAISLAASPSDAAFLLTRRGLLGV
ncbi:MAG: DUF6596 domain-containing protein, partial [Rhizobiaceae bacterium]